MGRLKGRRAFALGAATLFAATAIVGIAGADNARTITVGLPATVRMTGDFGPRSLSRTVREPIAVQVDGAIEPAPDREFASLLREVQVEGDKNASIDVAGYPVCHRDLIMGRTSEALANCRGAIVGHGFVTIVIFFAETPVRFRHELLIFNGGRRGGVTTFFIRAYLIAPTPQAIVSTVKVQRKRRGPFGTLATVTIPSFVGGDASITSFHVELGKKPDRDGRQVDVLSAKCRAGGLRARVASRLADGSRYYTTIIRPCRVNP